MEHSGSSGAFPAAQGKVGERELLLSTRAPLSPAPWASSAVSCSCIPAFRQNWLPTRVGPQPQIPPPSGIGLFLIPLVKELTSWPTRALAS